MDQLCAHKTGHYLNWSWVMNSYLNKQEAGQKQPGEKLQKLR